MTKIEELRFACNASIQVPLKELRPLLDILEMQHETLKELEEALPCGVTIAALAAFEEWNKP